MNLSNIELEKCASLRDQNAVASISDDDCGFSLHISSTRKVVSCHYALACEDI